MNTLSTKIVSGFWSFFMVCAVAMNCALYGVTVSTAKEAAAFWQLTILFWGIVLLSHFRHMKFVRLYEEHSHESSLAVLGDNSEPLTGIALNDWEMEQARTAREEKRDSRDKSFEQVDAFLTEFITKKQSERNA